MGATIPSVASAIGVAIVAWDHTNLFCGRAAGDWTHSRLSTVSSKYVMCMLQYLRQAYTRTFENGALMLACTCPSFFCKATSVVKPIVSAVDFDTSPTCRTNAMWGKR